MMKITQLLTNLKLWQGIFVSFLLLISLNLNSQNVGDDLLANSNGQVDTSSGWGGSGAGCFSWGGGTYDGVTQCGWTSGAGLNYAPGNGNHGPTHSGDRMFKSYKTNGSNGEFIAQEVGELALGTYTYSFFHRWTGGAVDYTEGAPKFTIKKANADGGWDNVLVVDLAVGETGASGAWTETTGSWENTEGGQYKIQVYKNGVANAGLAQNLHLDTFTFVYSAEPAQSALSIKGLGDLDIPSSAGKFVHLVATDDIADLSVYGLGSANNGGGTDGEEWSFPEGLSATSGDNILLYRDLSVVDAYMDASNTFDLLLEAPSSSSSPVSSNGNDALELFFNGSVVETFGEIDFEGGSGNYDHTWAFNDSWAYNVDGEWTYGGPNCSDDEWDNGPISACDSSCPYPFVVCEVAPTGCEGLINMYDSYGDGWNGGTLDVYVNDVLAGTFANTSDAAANEAQSIPVSTSFGDVVTFDFTCGSFCGETSFTVTDADGNVVASGGGSSTADATFECLDPNAINLSVSATTDGGSATFMFDIANFTVGAAAGEGDGHIHYSLNGGDEVMVYSTDDLTLSNLPNGDHTIVFSLVDANHAPLDPAVEATVEFSTFDGTAACDETVTYTQVANGDYTISMTATEGQVASVTVNATMENGWDFLYVTDGAGNALIANDGTDQTTGSFVDLTYSSTDGTVSVNVTNDGSIQNGDVTLAFTCATPQTAVTFSVNTENIEVGANGIYVGGGVLGGSDAYALSDDDGDGVWETTIDLEPGTTGNYIFFNSPNGSGDWGTKEILDGQECADPNNFNDRILDPVGEEDYTLLHCFGECSGNGTGECPVPATTYDVTFSVDMSNFPGGLADGDIVYLNGNFVGWCGDCNPMSDDDGDGIWTITMQLEDGDWEYKFTVNGWNSQELWDGDGTVSCPENTDNGEFENRALTVAGEDMVLPTVYWNLCVGDSAYNITFNLDATAIDVGANGMYMGGGILGGANAVAMSDDDGDGFWTATILISTDQIGGNYTFLNSPNSDSDWGTKEDISGQECADADNFDDRIVPEFSGDAEFCYVFSVCTDGSCGPDPITIPGCEDFEDGADGWTFIDAGGNTTLWTVGTASNDDGTNSTQGIFHGYDSATPYNDWAVSPSYDTSGLVEGTATVSYDEICNWCADSEAHNVYYSVDYAGDATTATWVALFEGVNTDAEDTWVSSSYSVPSAESVVLAFNYVGTYGANWNVDNVCIDGTLSTTDTELLDMRIYPNPTSSMINVQFDRDIELTLYNMLGQEIMRTNNKQVDISALQQGNYIVIVRDLESNYVKNFNIIKK